MAGAVSVEQARQSEQKWEEAGKEEKPCGKFVLVYLMWVDVAYVNVYYIIENNNDELPPYSEPIYYHTSSSEKYPSVYVWISLG